MAPPTNTAGSSQPEATVTDPSPPSATIGEQPVDSYIHDLFSKLVKATSLSNKLPSQDDYKFYNSVAPFRRTMENHSNRLLSSISGFMNEQQQATSWLDIEDPADKYDNCIDLLDRLFEAVDSCLDDVKGTKKNKNLDRIEQNIKDGRGDAATSAASHRRKEIFTRPQNRWSDVDNSNFPFVPKIVEKPNSISPLPDHAQLKMDLESRMAQSNGALSSVYGNLNTTTAGTGGSVIADSFPHPYALEIASYKPLNVQLVARKEKLPQELSAPCTWIETEQALRELASRLDHVDEMAIDLEAHSYRTFQGFVCLMQISTRKEDFLIDTLELRQHMHCLNSSFTNPRIVKVLHGADHDITWLQRDFGLYIVNMFDTGIATRVLEFPSYSLAFILKLYCGIEADKRYQLADWRIRPLPSEMVKYAREDTHYLLYIYDRIQNELIARSTSANQDNLVVAVLERSRQLCLSRYEKELFTDSSYLSLYQRFNQTLTQQQLNVFRSLYRWRDHIARKDDESSRYVLPNHMMFRISEEMPSDHIKLFGCCNPVPHLVRQNADQLLRIIADAKQLPNIPGDSILKAKSTRGDFPQVRLSLADTRSLMQSPVLTTDQLYQTAGWTSASAQPAEPILSSMLNFDSAMSSDSSDYDEEAKATHVQLKVAPISTAHSSDLFGSSLDDADDETEDSVSANNDLLENRIKVDSIKKSISLFSITTPQAQRYADTRQARQPETDPQIETKAAAPHLAAPDATPLKETMPPPAPPLLDSNITPPDEKVPKSLTEIFKLSKKNRMRNKKKLVKRQQEDSMPDLDSRSSQDDQADDDHSAPVAASSSSSGAGEDPSPVEFMKSIGWIAVSNIASVPEPVNPHHPHPSKHNVKRGH